MSLPLAEHLQRYRDDIARQLQEVEGRRASLTASWYRLRENWQGEGADAFHQAFHRALSRFDRQAERLQRMLPQLDVALENLRAHFNSEG